MPRSKSVLKRTRQNEGRRARNRANVSKVKTSVKKLDEAIRKNDAETARQMLPDVAATIDKAVTKKALSKNAASRRKSSLARRINALG